MSDAGRCSWRWLAYSAIALACGAPGCAPFTASGNASAVYSPVDVYPVGHVLKAAHEPEEIAEPHAASEEVLAPPGSPLRPAAAPASAAANMAACQPRSGRRCGHCNRCRWRLRQLASHLHPGRWQAPSEPLAPLPKFHPVPTKPVFEPEWSVVAWDSAPAVVSPAPLPTPVAPLAPDPDPTASPPAPWRPRQGAPLPAPPPVPPQASAARSEWVNDLR